MDDYDFEVLVEDINKNKQLALEKDKERARTRCRNKLTIIKYTSIITLSLLIIIGLIIIIQFEHKTIISTPYGGYECRGTIIRICNGSKEVEEYIKGVNNGNN